MAYTTPRTWVAGAVLTAAQLNTDVRDNTAAIRACENVYADTTNTGWTASTSFTAIGCDLSLPAGLYVIEASGYFDWSEGVARDKSAEIWNNTDSTQLVATSVGGTTNGKCPFHLMGPVTIAGTKVYQLRLKVSAVDGAQLIGSPRIWARPVLSIL